MHLRLFLIVLLSACSCYLNAQGQNYGMFNTILTHKISSRFTAGFDSQFRTTDKFEQMQSFLLRPALHYTLFKNITVTAGYNYTMNKRKVNTVSGFLPEHGLWQQFMHSFKWRRGITSNRFRFEERFLPVAGVVNNKLHISQYKTSYRLRYALRNMIPLTKNAAAFTNGYYLIVQDEVFLNTGDQSNTNKKTFDQNRVTGALGYRFASQMNVEAGFMYQKVQSRTSFSNNHVAQLTVSKRL